MVFTDAFNSSYWNFEKCLQWAQANDVHYIECGTIDGVSWLHGLGYQPHVALHEDPVHCAKMDGYGVKFSQLDAAIPFPYPMPLHWAQYIINTIRWGYLAGCTHIDTTDHVQAGRQTHEEALEMMKRVYGEVLDVAVHYDMIINIEPHGYYTTKPDFMAQMLDFFDTPLLRMIWILAIPLLPDKTGIFFCNRFKIESVTCMSGRQRNVGSITAWRIDRHRCQQYRDW